VRIANGAGVDPVCCKSLRNPHFDRSRPDLLQSTITVQVKFFGCPKFEQNC
jgi:hypothetical protein